MEQTTGEDHHFRFKQEHLPPSDPKRPAHRQLHSEVRVGTAGTPCSLFGLSHEENAVSCSFTLVCFLQQEG